MNAVREKKLKNRQQLIDDIACVDEQLKAVIDHHETDTSVRVEALKARVEMIKTRIELAKANYNDVEF